MARRVPAPAPPPILALMVLACGALAPELLHGLWTHRWLLAGLGVAALALWRVARALADRRADAAAGARVRLRGELERFAERVGGGVVGFGGPERGFVFVHGRWEGRPLLVALRGGSAAPELVCELQLDDREAARAAADRAGPGVVARRPGAQVVAEGRTLRLEVRLAPPWPTAEELARAFAGLTRLVPPPGAVELRCRPSGRAPLRCPYCHDALAATHATCPGCGTPHHDDCLEAAGCAVFACRRGQRRGRQAVA